MPRFEGCPVCDQSEITYPRILSVLEEMLQGDIAICPVCQSILYCVRLSYTGVPYNHFVLKEEVDRAYHNLKQIARVGNQDYIENLEYLPPKIAHHYKKAKDYASKDAEIALTCIRKILDEVSKEQVDTHQPKLPLGKRMKACKDSPEFANIYDWLDQLRQDGNEAAHEIPDAETLAKVPFFMKTIELWLQALYVLPQQIENNKKALRDISQQIKEKNFTVASTSPEKEPQDTPPPKPPQEKAHEKTSDR